jgi:hypothetical protein
LHRCASPRSERCQRSGWWRRGDCVQSAQPFSAREPATGRRGHVVLPDPQAGHRTGGLDLPTADLASARMYANDWYRAGDHRRPLGSGRRFDGRGGCPLVG